MPFKVCTENVLGRVTNYIFYVSVIDRISIIRPVVANYSSLSPWSHPPNSRSFSVPLLSSILNFQDAQLWFPGLYLLLELCFNWAFLHFK